MSGRPRSPADYAAIVRRRYKVIVLSTVGVAVIAFLVSSQQAKVFEATANVLLSRQNLGAELTGISNPNLSGDPARLTQTASELARSGQVASLAIRLSKVRGVSQQMFLGNSTVTSRANADVLTFSVKNADPVIAARLTNAFAAAFVQYKLDIDTETLANARTELTSKIRGLRATGDTSSSNYRNLVLSEQQLRTMQLLQSKDFVLRSSGLGTQVAPTPKRTTVLGAVLGLVVGLGLAFLWEALDGRMRSGRQIEDVLGLPLLGRVPEPARRLRAGNRLALIDDASSAYAEALRMLRSNLEVARLEADARVIMVTSYGQREGKSTTIANLAVAFARSGKNVALVDLDVRQPIQATFFNLPDGAGVSDVVLDGVPLRQAIRQVNVSRVPNTGAGRADAANQTGRLAVLPVGRPPGSPWELAASDGLAALLAQLRSDYDLVLVDAPPMGVVGDAKAIAPSVDALLVVAREGMVTLPGMDDFVRELSLVTVPTLGFALTGVDIHETYGYGAKETGASAPAPKTTESAPVGQLSSRRAGRKSPWIAAPPKAKPSEDADRSLP